MVRHIRNSRDASEGGASAMFLEEVVFRCSWGVAGLHGPQVNILLGSAGPGVVGYGNTSILACWSLARTSLPGSGFWTSSSRLETRASNFGTWGMLLSGYVILDVKWKDSRPLKARTSRIGS